MKIARAFLAVAVLAAGCTTVQEPRQRTTVVQVQNGQPEQAFVFQHCITAPYFGGIFDAQAQGGGAMPVLGITCLSRRDGYLENIFCEPRGMICRVADRMPRDARSIRVENELRSLAERHR